MSTESEKSPLRQKDIRTGAQQERERIIALLKAEFGEEYYELGICGRIVALIKGDVTWSEEVSEMKKEWPE